MHVGDVLSPRCGTIDDDFLFFADRVVLVRRENRVPLELLASRFGVTSHFRNILEHIYSSYVGKKIIKYRYAIISIFGLCDNLVVAFVFRVSLVLLELLERLASPERE